MVFVCEALCGEVYMSHESKNLQAFYHEYLALINRAGGLYGRILTEVVSTD